MAHPTALLSESQPHTGRYLQRRIDATDADISAISSLLRKGVRVGNEQQDREHHLDEMIIKPWGKEFRAYADDFIDVWHLQINSGHATSMHAHPRKVTYLLCLAGTGVTTSLAGAVDLNPGVVLRIGRGAFHSTENAAGSDEPLVLIEVETPRNKYDLMRLRDGYQREGAGYEQASVYMDAQPKKVPYLPNAKMCKASPCGGYVFGIHSGMDIHYRRRAAGDYLVPMGIRELVNDQMDILTNHPDDTREPQLDSYYLSIRHIS